MDSRPNKINHNLQILYRINSQDEVVFVNERWSQFAIANNASELVREKVLNRKLWDFIADETILEIYQKLVQKVRAGHQISFKFRCDSPDLKRLLGMTMTLLKNKQVQFETCVIWIEPRSHQNILEKDERFDVNVLIICSWCNKINVQGEIWQEVEEAVLDWGLFELETLPQVSHGMCFTCYQTIVERYQNYFGEK